MPDIDRRACFSLDLSKIIVTDTEIVDHRYLFYYLKSPIAREYMLAHSNGSTVMHLSVKAVPNMEINLPPLDQQKKIADILSSLDLYNSISKGSAYYVDDLREEAKSVAGYQINAKIRMENESQAADSAALITKAGGMAEASGRDLTVSGDYAGILSASLDDADTSFRR